ncbi:mannose-6-phosphate isomerase [Hypoxylon sp. NC1633]|nr:mannose-6-phosphate isomerase [Hypoxylon sp. NC1633]
MSPPLVFQLSGTCNNYPWGKKGKQSLAAQLCAQTPGIDFHIKDDEFYSEMWFGDYPDFPARKLDTGELLADVLQQNKEKLLGKKVIEKFESQLPYLPKILSIAKALPLQLHPNKELARKLHEEDPSNFTDPNHKPEIAVALSKFEFDTEQTEKWTDETLRTVTRNLLKSELETVKQVQTELSKVSKDQLGEAAYILELLPRLQDQYGPEDAGSLVALLCMNFLVFNPGDAIWIPADGIHAYLAGDIVECMARSNNVLNVGFCPPGDRNNVDLFTKTLTFKAHSRDDVYLPSQKSDKSKKGKTVVYRPPMSEFDMLRTELEGGESEELTAGEGPGVFIVTKGKGVMHADSKEFQLKEGFIFFFAPGVSVKWESQDGMQIHMAVA